MTGARLARKSFGEPYLCVREWPEDCFVQCGGNGIVVGHGSFEEMLLSTDPLKALGDEIKKPTSYRTAFFEAFPRNPDTFIRGEGKTIEEAEEQTWLKFQKYLACKGHEFEKRGYRNGAGFCKHCGMFGSKVFEPEPPTKEDLEMIEKFNKRLAEGRETMARLKARCKEQKKVNKCR